MNIIIAILALGWAVVVSFISITAMLMSYRTHREIENLESWKILSEIKIPDEKGGGE